MTNPAERALTASHSGIRVEAPAKINLFLHVTGRREDGYHEIESLVAFAGTHDRVEVRPHDGLRFEIDGPFAAALSVDTENLAVKAARALAAEAAVPTDVRIRLHKALPVAAGIGGGSADAAAALRALNTLWRLSVPAERLGALALGLGADVPVCLSGRPGIVRGIGERIEPAAVPPNVPLVLVNPMIPLATAAVFAARAGPFSQPASFEAAPADVAALALALQETRNDLTPAARRACPQIDGVLEAIRTAPACLIARLSGSGPTCFGLFPTEETASLAAARIAEAHPGWWVRPTRLRTAPRAGLVAGPND